MLQTFALIRYRQETVDRNCLPGTTVAQPQIVIIWRITFDAIPTRHFFLFHFFSQASFPSGKYELYLGIIMMNTKNHSYHFSESQHEIFVLVKFFAQRTKFHLRCDKENVRKPY